MRCPVVAPNFLSKFKTQASNLPYQTWDYIKNSKSKLLWNSWNVTYTIFVSLLFGAFAYDRAGNNIPKGFSYFASSVLMNAPMAWFFSESAKKAVKRFRTKKELAYNRAFKFAAVLALGTTFAGIKLSYDMVNDVKKISAFAWMVNPASFWPLFLFSVFNTVTTRFFGSVSLLNASWNGWKNLRKNRPMDQFLKDLKRYGSIVNLTLPKKVNDKDLDMLVSYRKEFYATLEEKKIQPGSRAWKHFAKEGVFTLLTAAIILVPIINMMPLWIALTVKGADSISDKLGDFSPFIVYAALSNQLFYINSARKFVPSVLSFIKPLRRKWKVQEGMPKKALFSVLCLLGLGAWAAAAYFSGKGYAEEAVKFIKTKGEHFGNTSDKVWFSWMGWYTNLFMPVYAPFVASVSAGSVVNGGSALRFCLDRFSFFKTPSSSAGSKFGPQEAQDALERYIATGRATEGSAILSVGSCH